MPDTPHQPGTEDVSATEQVHQREAGIDVALSEQLRALRDRLVAAFEGVDVLGFRGELTLIAQQEYLVDLLRFCRDDPDVACQYLMDLSGVHWPGGEYEEQTHETTGWPTVTTQREGRIEVDYLLYSVTHNHRFRIRVSVSEDDPTLPTVTGLWASANFMEREAYDFFGVRFIGHPNLTRIHMPDGWEGHPQRKDYPLGGVDVQYKGAMIPPPDQRHY